MSGRHVDRVKDAIADVFQKPAEPYRARGRLDPTGFSRHVTFQTRPPPGDLALFVEHLWLIRCDAEAPSHSSEEVMHRPYVDLFVSARQSGIQGTFRGRRTYRAEASSRIVGVRLRPGAFRAFWPGGDLADLRDRIVDLRKVFPETDPRYVARVSALDDEAALDALLSLLRGKDPQPDANIDKINDIIAAIESDDTLRTVGAVAAAFRRSERWLQQFFRDYVGVGLKWLLQRHRLLAAAERIRAADRPDWAAIAYDLGYSSQQHFNTDFKAALGRAPGAYKRWTARQASL